MYKYPQSILNLINSFASLPGVGNKTAERYAFYVLNSLNIEDIDEFATNLKNVKENIKHCKICGNLSEDDICDICKDSKRDHSIVMVVENERDVLSLEKLDEYKGVYHILGGAITFSKGISAADLNIDSLINRVEGETTARYLKELLNDYEIKISRIAYGLPVGQDLFYADQMTLLKALEGRREYK